MKRTIVSLTVFSFFVLALSACSGALRFNFDVDTDLPPGLSIDESSIRLTSTHNATVDGRNQPVICDDQETTLTYSFEYSGNLETYSTYLVGRDTGDEAELTNQTQIASGGYVEHSVRIPAGLAPLAIVPNPIPIGASILYVTLDPDGYGDQYYIRFNDIPVLQTC